MAAHSAVSIHEESAPHRFKIGDVLTSDEIKSLRRVSNLRGFLAVATTWGLIAAAFAVVVRWPSPVTLLAAWVVLGGRQLALAVLMHESAHRILFTNRGVNDFVGRWVLSYPVWLDVERYRESHLRHHSFLGTDADPDRNLVAGLPMSRATLAKKFLFDLVGITAVLRSGVNVLTDFGFLEFSATGKVTFVKGSKRTLFEILRHGLTHMGGFLLVQMLLFATLFAWGHPWLYLLWCAAWVSPNSVFHRMRALHEHGLCPADPDDPLNNTRTTLANVAARLAVAPHFCNFHIEHHLLMTVPCYELPRLHRLLRERGALRDACVASGYVQVLGLVTQRGNDGTPI